MDPAVELATLVVSYLWPLRELYPEARRVGELASLLPRLPDRVCDDYALLARLRNIADRTDEETWLPEGSDASDELLDLGARLTAIAERRQLSRAPVAPGTPAPLSGRAGQWVQHQYDALRVVPVAEDYVTLATEVLATFMTHAEWLVARPSIARLRMRPRDPTAAREGTEPVDVTRERFTERVASTMRRKRFLGDVAQMLDYCPLLLRQIDASSATLSRREAASHAYLRSLLDDPRYPAAVIRASGNQPLPFALVFHEELAEIDRSRECRHRGKAAPLPLWPPAKRAYQRSLVGLCISGGGIRSATFAMGLLQGLANRRWLPHIDYLSTVSGGGYIGAWLLAWVKRVGSIHAVQDSLRGYHSCAPAPETPASAVPSSAKPRPSQAPALNPDPGAEHVRPIRLLREFSNYLAPRFSAFSSDTWTMVSIWMRNTVLNLLVLTLFMMAVLMVPRVLASVFVSADVRSAMWSCCAALGVASIFVGLNLRSFDHPAIRTRHATRRNLIMPKITLTQRGDASFLIVTTIGVPVLIATFFAVRALLEYPPPVPSVPSVPPMLLAEPPGETTSALRVFLVSFVTLACGIALTAVLSQRYKRPAGLAEASRTSIRRTRRGVLRAVGSAVSGTLAAAIGALILTELWKLLVPWIYFESRRGTWVALAFGPFVLIMLLSLVIVLYLGFEGQAAADDRREWWSRLGGWLNLITIGWAVGATISYFSPYLIARGGLSLGTLGLGWGAVTGGGAMLAASGRSNGINLPLDRNRLTSALISAAPYLFMIGFFVAVTATTHFLIYTLQRQGWLGDTGRGLSSLASLPFSLVRYSETYWANLDPQDWRLGIVSAGLLLLSLLLASRVDVNEFSMHHFYKNRLVRAYLGASRSRIHRRPNAFTGLDLDDDIKLWRLTLDDPSNPTDERSDCRASFIGPYSIINATLNLTTGDELAYQERKAQSFAFTPLYCGYDFCTKQTLVSETTASQFAFRPSRYYGYTSHAESRPDEVGIALIRRGWNALFRPHDWGASGVDMGTAVAISGAAANPNAGYHSSPAVAFLLTVFNARLGWWLGNPRLARWTSSSPSGGLFYLLSELFGFSGVQRDYVNLSDGGHFDNMGLYELVRRRCRYIVVCDGEQDDKYSFNGLAGAIRKCRVDFGVVIDIATDQVKPTGARSRQHVAVGTITYPGGGCGTLVYVKASLTGDEPGDVQEYRRRHREFPHQTTADQFFDESQFESYRALGQHIADETFPEWPAHAPEAFGEAARGVFADIKARCAAGRPAVATP